jgi:hypothetical protein
VSLICHGSGYRKSAPWKSLTGPLQSGFAPPRKGLTIFLIGCKAIHAPNSARMLNLNEPDKFCLTIVSPTHAMIASE